MIKLLGAREEGVRVAAAVYLRFDNSELSQRELEKIAKKCTRGGLWAALTLVRMGHKGQVPRLINLVNRLETSERDDDPVQILRIRARILLSNSAAASNVPQPPDSDGLGAWWEKYGAKIALVDSWGEELAKQRID